MGPLKNKAGQYVSDPDGMANLLQKQFCSVFSEPNCEFVKDPDFPQALVSLDDFDFTIADILKAIDSMRLYAAPGEDEVPVILLKSCKETISIPLFLLWKTSYETGIIHLCFYHK